MPAFSKDRLANIEKRNANKRSLVDGRTRWSEETKLKAVEAWLLLGNMPLVSQAVKVPFHTLEKWKMSTWWPEFVKQIRATENIEMDTKLTDLVQKSLDAAYDRIVNGDFIYDQKSGEIRRKPASLRDIHRVAVDILGKRELLRDKFEATGGEKTVSVEEHLKLLATNMAKWFEGHDKKVKTIELEEIEDAVYAERETGLQEGERPVQLPTGECEEEGGEEQGEED